jgi:hypothetical protein
MNSRRFRSDNGPSLLSSAGGAKTAAVCRRSAEPKPTAEWPAGPWANLNRSESKRGRPAPRAALKSPRITRAGSVVSAFGLKDFILQPASESPGLNRSSRLRVPPTLGQTGSAARGIEVGFIFPDPTQQDGEPACQRDARPVRPAPLHRADRVGSVLISQLRPGYKLHKRKHFYLLLHNE